MAKIAQSFSKLVIFVVCLIVSIAAQTPAATTTYDFVLEESEDIPWIALGLQDEGSYRKAYGISLSLRNLSSDGGNCTLLIQVNGHPIGTRRLSVGRQSRFRHLGYDFAVAINRVEARKVFGSLQIPEDYPGLRDGLATPPEGKLAASHPETEVYNINIHRDVEFPKLVRRTLPSYTPRAIQAGVSGKVLMQLVVRKDGTTDRFRILRPLGHGLDEAAVEEVANEWLFDPGTKEGRPVDIAATIEVSFTLARRR